jgi:hypothetical protein
VQITRQQHPQNESAVVHDLWSAGSDRHTFDRGQLAGGYFMPEALILHQTQAARPGWAEIRMVAQCGNDDPSRPRRLEHRLARVCGDRFTVDLQLQHVNPFRLRNARFASILDRF